MEEGAADKAVKEGAADEAVEEEGTVEAAVNEDAVDKALNEGCEEETEEGAVLRKNSSLKFLLLGCCTGVWTSVRDQSFSRDRSTTVGSSLLLLSTPSSSCITRLMGMSRGGGSDINGATPSSYISIS